VLRPPFSCRTRQDTEWLQTEFAVSLDFCAVFRGLRWRRLGRLFDLLFNQESVRQPDYAISLFDLTRQRCNMRRGLVRCLDIRVAAFGPIVHRSSAE